MSALVDLAAVVNVESDDHEFAPADVEDHAPVARSEPPEARQRPCERLAGSGRVFQVGQRDQFRQDAALDLPVELAQRLRELVRMDQPIAHSSEPSAARPSARSSSTSKPSSLANSLTGRASLTPARIASARAATP